MKRYHCWDPNGGETERDALSFDALSPALAAEAFVERTADEDREGTYLIRVRGPGDESAMVRVACRIEAKYTSEVIEPREES